jgi:hypothetical protein
LTVCYEAFGKLGCFIKEKNYGFIDKPDGLVAAVVVAVVDGDDEVDYSDADDDDAESFNIHVFTLYI